MSFQAFIIKKKGGGGCLILNQSAVLIMGWQSHLSVYSLTPPPQWYTQSTQYCLCD